MVVGYACIKLTVLERNSGFLFPDELSGIGSLLSSFLSSTVDAASGFANFLFYARIASNDLHNVLGSHYQPEERGPKRLV